MTVSELMTGVTPDANYEGFVMVDDMVLAIDTAPDASTPTTVPNYAVVGGCGITGVTSALNPTSQEKAYIRTGKNTHKTGTARSFTISGDRYVGDAAQDFLLSHAMKYGRGKEVVTNYVYFNVLTVKGEKGQVSVVVNNDGSGEAENNAGIEVVLNKYGDDPAEYTYSAS